MTFWRLRRDCDVKYDVRYHKIAQNFIQFMFQCQKMIWLSLKFIWVHIFIWGTRWWCQNSNILTFWKLRRDCDVKSQNGPRFHLNYVIMPINDAMKLKIWWLHIFTRHVWQHNDVLALLKVKISWFWHNHSDPRVKMCCNKNFKFNPIICWHSNIWMNLWAILTSDGRFDVQTSKYKISDITITFLGWNCVSVQNFSLIGSFVGILAHLKTKFWATLRCLT